MRACVSRLLGHLCSKSQRIMGDMLEIVGDEVNRTGSCRLEWSEIHNVYFRGNNAVNDVKAWAERNGLHPSFDYLEESLTHVKVRAVTFLPKNPAK